MNIADKLKTKEGLKIIRSGTEKTHENAYNHIVNTIKGNGGGTHGAKSYFHEQSNNFVSFIYYFLPKELDLEQLLTGFEKAKL